MAHLNLRERVIETTIAYVGSEPSGATNLEHVKRDVKRGRAGAVESTLLGGGRVLSLAWRPRDAAKLNDCELAVKLVAPEGAVDAGAVERVLADADGLVLVLDADPGARDQNERAVDTVKKALARAPEKRVPVIVQVNRADGDGPHDAAGVVLAEAWPRVGACAAKGDGVMETLQRAVADVVDSMQGAPSQVTPRPPSSPRAEGNPLLSALREILLTAVREPIAALEQRLLTRLDEQRAAREEEARATSARLASFGARLGGVEAAVLQVGERAHAASERQPSRDDVERLVARIGEEARSHRDATLERIEAIDVGMQRIEAALMEVGERASAAAERAAVQRDEAAERVVALDAWMERLESTVLELGKRAGEAIERTAAKGDVERLEKRIVEGAGAQTDAVLAELREVKRALRDEVARAAVAASQPLHRALEASSAEWKAEWKKLASDDAIAAIAATVQRLDEASDALRERLDALTGESRGVGARVDELAAKVQLVDGHVARRVAEVRDALRALGEQAETRGAATDEKVAAIVEELRKKKSWFGG